MGRPYVDDPVPGDEKDPEYREELFETFKVMRSRPEEIVDKKMAKEYAEWLEKNGDQASRS